MPIYRFCILPFFEQGTSGLIVALLFENKQKIYNRNFTTTLVLPTNRREAVYKHSLRTCQNCPINFNLGMMIKVTIKFSIRLDIYFMTHIKKVKTITHIIIQLLNNS